MTRYEPNPQIIVFLEALAHLDAAGRARLRRNAGKPLDDARGVAYLFYPLLPPGLPAYQEETYFLVATLYPLADSGKEGDLGTALRRARREGKNAKGLDRRMQSLLDADSAQLPFRLRQAVHFLRSERVPIHWPTLLQDLLHWNLPDRPVQKRWAHSYFAKQMPEADSQPDTKQADS